MNGIDQRTLRALFVLTFLLSAVLKADAELNLLREKDALHCVLSDQNQSSTISWIYPTENIDANEIAQPKEVTSWRPSSKAEELELLNCNVFENRACGRWKGKVIYNIAAESNGFSLGPILDYRWNKLPMIETRKMPNGDPYFLAFEEFGRFTLHISVLAKENAYIILSDDIKLQSSGLYIIELDSYKNKTLMQTGIRKCVAGIPNYEKSRVEDIQCQFDETTGGNFQTSNNLHNGERWIHATIHISRSRLIPFLTPKVNITVKINGSNVAQWIDRENTLWVKYLYLKTYLPQTRPTYWKLHRYFMMSSEVGLIRSPEIVSSKYQKLCLSIIYRTDTLTSVRIRENITTVLIEEDLPPGPNWQTKILKAVLQANYKYQVFFNFQTDRRFYLGDVRVCNEDEVLVSTLQTSQDYKCSSVDGAQLSVEIRNVTEKISSTFKCLGDNFDSHCSLSCSTVLGTECRGVTTCGPGYCSCLSGFSSQYSASTGRQLCNKECSSGTYGPNCNHQCGECLNNVPCDLQTGNCTSGCKRVELVPPFCPPGPANLAVIIPTIIFSIILLICVFVFLIKFIKSKMMKTNTIIAITPTEPNFAPNINLVVQLNEDTENEYEVINEQENIPEDESEEIPDDITYEQIDEGLHYDDIGNVAVVPEHQPEYIDVLPN